MVEEQISEPFVTKAESPKKREAKKSRKASKHFLRLMSNKHQQLQAAEG